MSVSELLFKIHIFLNNNNFEEFLTYDSKKGAGTLNLLYLPLFFSNKSHRVYSIERTSRPDDGFNLNIGCRLATHTQIQIYIINENINNLNILFDLFRYLNINLEMIYLKPDNWEHFVISAKGKGYEIYYSGIEIGQITQFEEFGGKLLNVPVLELAIGLERLSMIIDNQYDIKDINLSNNTKIWDIIQYSEEVSYKESFLVIEQINKLIDIHFQMIDIMLTNHLYYGVLEKILNLSHYFNQIKDFYELDEYNANLIKIKKIFQFCYSKLFYNINS